MSAFNQQQAITLVSSQLQEMASKISKSQKRSREEDKENQTQLKKRQAKSLFRPWSDEQINETPEEVAYTKKALSNKKDNLNSLHQQPKNVPVPAPVPGIITPYHLAVQQQQRQTALALQQAALYQRQLLMAHVWAQQQRAHQQQQQMYHLHHQQQQMRQQMFVFGQQNGQK